MRLGEIRSKTVRKTITEKIVRFKVDHETHLLKDKESYIVATTEIEGEHGLTRDTSAISNDSNKCYMVWVVKTPTTPLHLILHSGMLAE